MIAPDKWVLVKIPQGAKVLGSWSGGYLDGDSWKMSSGVTSIEQDPEDDDYWLIHNVSGSIYKCHKQRIGMNSMASNILNKLKEMSDEVCLITVEEYNEKSE